MSLDALADELRNFGAALEDFTDLLRSARTAQAEVAERAQGLWEDEFRREFERRHAEYASDVEAFTELDAERYLDFIHEKRHRVEEYLRG